MLKRKGIIINVLEATFEIKPTEMGLSHIKRILTHMLKVYHRFLILVEGYLGALQLLTFGEKLFQ